MSGKTFKKMNYYANSKTLEAIAELKKHQINISALVQETLQKKAALLKTLKEEV